jgi:16S rRNA (cytosine967-C5)-methyltransferase
VAENTREIVLDTLLALERGEEFSHRLIKAVLDKYHYLEERDRAFIKRLTEGTIERQTELDYYLNHFSSVPVRKMKPLIRCLMRMSVYQILYMDSVPDSAVCNEACKLAQKRKFGNLKGFVNGVLRSVVRQKDCLPMPDESAQPMEYLSVRYSMPLWLVELWVKSYGRERAERLLEGLLAIHPVSLRLRTDCTEEERGRLIQEMEAAGAKLHKSSLLPYLYTVENMENLTELPGFAQGLFVVQDASSALAVEAAGIKAGDFVVDICAAPGGKSILAAERAGRVLARDVSEAKTALIEENIARMGRDNITVEVHDATVADEKLFEQADVLLADVPCSGLGVMGKKRDIKYRVSEERIASICALQKHILESSWRYVKPGGVLLYSTCTINPAENEKMARWIEESFPFQMEEERQFMPGEDETDGFYYARFRRREE